MTKYKTISKYQYASYPLKLGYNDKSGRTGNTITDAKDNTIVWGCSEWGASGIQERNIAIMIIKSLNKLQPKFRIPNE